MLHLTPCATDSNLSSYSIIISSGKSLRPGTCMRKFWSNAAGTREATLAPKSQFLKDALLLLELASSSSLASPISSGIASPITRSSSLPNTAHLPRTSLFPPTLKLPQARPRLFGVAEPVQGHENASVAAIVVVHGVWNRVRGVNSLHGGGREGVHALGKSLGAEAVGEGGDAAEPEGGGLRGGDLVSLISWATE